MRTVRVLLLPGYGDSGPEHWQTLWERRFGYMRVRQANWEHPERLEWVMRLEEIVRTSPPPVVLVAHSLGCILVAHWAVLHDTSPIAGALLVAPPDVDETQHLVPEVASFAPVPLAPLPFPTTVVMSQDDPYADPARSAMFAEAWGARLVDVGACGHVNGESALGDWPAGHALLAPLLASD